MQQPRHGQRFNSLVLVMYVTVVCYSVRTSPDISIQIFVNVQNLFQYIFSTFRLYESSPVYAQGMRKRSKRHLIAVSKLSIGSMITK